LCSITRSARLGDPAFARLRLRVRTREKINAVMRDASLDLARDGEDVEP
jgi:hypothetical protein